MVLGRRRKANLGLLLLALLLTAAATTVTARTSAGLERQGGTGADHWPGPLVVMTYNIHAGRDVNGYPNLDGIAAVLAQSGAHIVGLQEVDNRVLRSGLVDQARYLAQQAGWNHTFGGNLALPPGFYGNALLSAFPITGYQNQRLSSPRETRGYLRGVVEAPGGHQLAVYVTHLGLDHEERLQHLDRLLQDVRQETGPVLLLGDFNSLPGSREVAMVANVLQDAVATTLVSSPTFPAGAAAHRIDYVFVSSHFEVLSAGTVASLASDHYPVRVELRLKGRP
ncbi:MAG: endonuclease/exonuclease/phosphatase family protein [Bacillota bacterium]